jgi:putative DNA methylase
MNNRIIGSGINSLASSIVLVCASAPPPHGQPRSSTLSRLSCLMHIHLQAEHRPVDLAQAAIGPGMAVYTRYAWCRRRG